MTGLLASAGCTHNYYYGVNPCGPAPTTVVPYGSVCEVPSEVPGGSSTTVGGAVTRPGLIASPVLGGPRPPKVVVSEPNDGSRFAWRRSDPDAGPVTTQVQGGAVEDPTVVR
jgi:hypothetical protein